MFIICMLIIVFMANYDFVVSYSKLSCIYGSLSDGKHIYSVLDGVC